MAVVIFSELLVQIDNVVFPTDVMAVMTATKTNASITAYSTAVGPDSSWRNFRVSAANFMRDHLGMRGALPLRGESPCLCRLLSIENRGNDNQPQRPD